MTAPNMVDGSILCYEVSKYGASITVRGNDDRPLILSCDVQDIESLRELVIVYERMVLAE